MKQAVRGGLLVAGLVLLAGIFWSVGWPAIAANLAAIGKWFFFLAALYLLAQLAFCMGWWAVIEPALPRSHFARVFGVYLAGDTVNYLTPGNFGGEPLKARLLERSLPMGSAVASLTIHKHADMVAQWLFVLAGVAVSLIHFSLPAAARWAALAGAALLGGLLWLLTWALLRGTYGPVLAWLGRWRPLAARARRYADAAQRVDASIRDFYTIHRGRWFAAVGWCLLGWCGGLLETYIVLRLLTRSEGWWTAFAVEALAMALNNMLLWVPARAGSAEGVRVAVFLLLGMPAAQGAAYGLVRRGRELLWLLPGALYTLARGAGRSAPKEIAAEPPGLAARELP